MDILYSFDFPAKNATPPVSGKDKSPLVMPPWLLPVIVAVAMVIFLVVSFTIHHKRFLQQRRHMSQYYLLKHHRVAGPVFSLSHLAASLNNPPVGDGQAEKRAVLPTMHRLSMKIRRCYSWSPQIFKNKYVRRSYHGERPQKPKVTDPEKQKGDTIEHKLSTYSMEPDSIPADISNQLREILENGDSTLSKASVDAKLLSLTQLATMSRSDSYKRRPLVVTTSTGALAIAQKESAPASPLVQPEMSPDNNNEVFCAQTAGIQNNMATDLDSRSHLCTKHLQQWPEDVFDPDPFSRIQDPRKKTSTSEGFSSIHQDGDCIHENRNACLIRDVRGESLKGPRDRLVRGALNRKYRRTHSDSFETDEKPLPVINITFEGHAAEKEDHNESDNSLDKDRNCSKLPNGDLTVRKLVNGDSVDCVDQENQAVGLGSKGSTEIDDANRRHLDSHLARQEALIDEDQQFPVSSLTFCDRSNINNLDLPGVTNGTSPFYCQRGSSVEDHNVTSCDLSPETGAARNTATIDQKFSKQSVKTFRNGHFVLDKTSSFDKKSRKDFIRSLKNVTQITKKLQDLQKPSLDCVIDVNSYNTVNDSPVCVGCERCKATSEVLTLLKENDVDNICEILEICENSSPRKEHSRLSVTSRENSFEDGRIGFMYRSFSRSTESLTGSWHGSFGHGYLDLSLTSLYDTVKN